MIGEIGGDAEEQAAEEGESLAQTLGGYLSDISVNVTSIEHALPEGDFDTVRAAATELALAEDYRFLSFGDAMLLCR